jgi:hypothetical protein
MLLFVKCFGVGVNETLCLLLDSSATIGELKSVVAHLRPCLTIKRYLYAGKELNNDALTLSDYRIVKESSIQCACQTDAPSSHEVPDSGDAPAPNWSAELPGVAPAFGRSTSSDAIQFGDAIVVHLVCARNLPPIDWNGLADPYVLLTWNGHTVKSSISKANLNPVWRQTFLFWMPPRPESSILALSVHTRVLVSCWIFSPSFLLFPFATCCFAFLF